MKQHSHIEDVDVIAPNFKKRLSGVTSTIIQLVPLQAETGVRIAALGRGLPDHLPYLRFRDLWRLWKRPAGKQYRVWHARRNVEMIGGIVLRDILRIPLKIIFTSASQREHQALTRWLILKMDHVIATSARTAAYLEVPFTIVMHGIDTARFSPPHDKFAAKEAVGLNPNTKYIGCFGRVRHQKGTDLFVEAIIPLLQENREWSGIIAGRTTAEHIDFERLLRERIERAGLTSRILFVGEHRDIEHWYRALDIFVAPQRWEGFGLTPLEAMACGVPVVATNVGAFSELILDGQTGYLICDFNAASIYACLKKIQENPGLRSSMSAAARNHMVSNFDLSREAEKLNSIYAKLQVCKN